MTFHDQTLNQPTPSAEGDVHDVLVVGGGLAGLAGALMLSRARRSVLVVDAGHPRNAPAEHTHGYLTRDGQSPLEMLAIGREEIRAYGNRIVEGEVTAIERTTGGLFVITGASGAVWRSRLVLVTTGLVDELPELPGLASLWGKDVVHCPYCFGWEIRDEAFGVLATSANAAAQAIMWRQWSSDVTLFLHTAPSLTAEQSEHLHAWGIGVVEGEVSGLEIEKGRLRGVHMASGTIVPRSVLIVGPRFAARHHLLEPLGVATKDHPAGIGYQAEADPTGRTSAAGVWVAGNLLDITAGIMQAAASGVLAAAAMNADLIADDTARVLGASRG